MSLSADEISKILDNLPIYRTNFEFKNFWIDTYPTSARLIASVLAEMELLHINKENLVLSLEKADLPAGEIRRNRRQIKIIDQQLEQFNNWWQKLSDQEKNIDANLLEKQEKEHWIKFLARQSAIELLTTDRVSTQTMSKMTNLDDNDFAASVKLCIEFMRMIKTTTVNIESIIAQQ